MDETIRENTGNQTPDATAVENAGQSERMFTQDEVNRIVSERLARDREKRTAQSVEDERERSLREREQVLIAKENRNRCEEYLREINLHEEYRGDFLNSLDTSDFDRFKQTVDRIGRGYIVREVVTGATVAHPPMVNSGSLDQRLSNAFKPPNK